MGQRMAILCQVGMVETNYLMKLMYFGLNLFNVILHNCQRWESYPQTIHTLWISWCIIGSKSIN